MSTWSSYSEYFYRYLLDNELENRNNKISTKYSFKKIIDSSCSNITSFRNYPNTSDYYHDYLFSIPDSTLDSSDYEQKNKFHNSKLNFANVIYKSQGNQTSRKINTLYYTSGNKKNCIHSSPYYDSSYTNINLSKYDTKATPRINVYRFLSNEIVNSMDTLTLYDNFSKNGHVKVVFMPSGVLNSGIIGLKLAPKLIDDDTYLDVNELLNIYPSCFFTYHENCSDYFMEPYLESNNYNKIETSWDGYTVKSQIYNLNSTFKTVNEDLDILEIKADNKSVYSSTIYSRNSLGIFVFRYYFDGEWKIKALNNVPYKHEDKVYYISVSPFLPDESIFLKTNNELLVYDGHKGHESDTIKLSSLIKQDDDIVHTLCYGMDNNNLILGGRQLYSMDKRTKYLSPLILPIKTPMTITSTKWTERNYDLEYPSRHYNKLLSGRYCSYSSYHRKSFYSFWKSFTALSTHPLYNYILATVCGASNSILIFDLRIPNSPLIDIPLTSAELIGSRFRSIKWHCENEYSLLSAFSWRQKYPVCIRFKIDSSFSKYSIVSDKEYEYKDFLDSDIEYDTSLMFDRTIYLNFSNSLFSQEDNYFGSCGPLIETQNMNINNQIHLTKDSTMSNIFHGYLGMTMISDPSINTCLVLMLTTSGRLLCIDINGRNIFLNSKNEKKHLVTSEVYLDNESDAFVGIDISVSNNIGIPVPDFIKFDKNYKFVKLKKIKIDNHYTEFNSFHLQDNIIKIQEQHFGDQRMKSHISINNCFLNDFKNFTTQQFNSKEILDRILSYNPINKDNGPIVSLSRFIELYGTEQTETHNVWYPVNNKLDHEYESEFKNPFVKVTQNCSCSVLKESIFAKYSLMLETIMNFIDHDINYDENIPSNYRNNLNTHNTNIRNNKRQRKKSNLSNSDDADNHTSLPPVSADGIHLLLINKLKTNESFIVDQFVASTFGDMLLLQSNLNHNVNIYDVDPIDEPLEQDKDVNIAQIGLHSDNCTINDVVFVDVTKDTDEFESLTIVDQVLSSWVLEHTEISKLDTESHCTRVFIPGDTIEHLGEHKRKQKKLISQILTSMDGKS